MGGHRGIATKGNLGKGNIGTNPGGKMKAKRAKRQLRESHDCLGRVFLAVRSTGLQCGDNTAAALGVEAMAKELIELRAEVARLRSGAPMEPSMTLADLPSIAAPALQPAMAQGGDDLDALLGIGVPRQAAQPVAAEGTPAQLDGPLEAGGGAVDMDEIMARYNKGRGALQDKVGNTELQQVGEDEKGQPRVRAKVRRTPHPGPPPNGERTAESVDFSEVPPLGSSSLFNDAVNQGG